MKKVVFFILIILVGFSCSIQKRQYTKGYYVGWKNQEHNFDKNALASNINSIKTIAEQPTSNTSYEPITASTDNSVILVPIKPFLAQNKFGKKLDFKLVTPVEDCDILVLKNGQELKVKVVEFGLDEIRYTICGSSDGAIFSKSNSEVYMIKYPNGTNTIVSQNNSQPNSNTNGNTSGKHIWVAVLLCLFLGWLGMHRFYLGYTGLGIMYLLFGTIGLILVFFIIGIPIVLALMILIIIDLIRIIAGSLKPKGGEYDKKP